jgi:hypothetical protein
MEIGEAFGFWEGFMAGEADRISSGFIHVEPLRGSFEGGKREEIFFQKSPDKSGAWENELQNV